MLVRIVARSGNLILMVCPDGEGYIPQNQISRFDEIGNWLKTNGEAIYGSRPAKVASDPSNTDYNVWYTTSKDGRYTYAFIFEWPKTGNITLRMAHPKWETKAYLLGYDKPLLAYDNPTDGMYVEFPEEMKNPAKRPGNHVWVMKYENW